MLGIIIGVSAVISLLSIGQGVEKFINSQFNALGTNLLFVLPKLSNSQGAQFVAQFANQTTLTQNDARALSDPALVPDISNVSAQIRLDALARYADAKLTTAVRGVNPGLFHPARPQGDRRARTGRRRRADAGARGRHRPDRGERVVSAGREPARSDD